MHVASTNAIDGKKAVCSGHLVLAMSIVLTSCACQNDQPPSTSDLVVFAAASAADVVTIGARKFEQDGGVRISISSGASGVLARQIDLGAPCDVFISADPSFSNRLQQQRSDTSVPVQLAANALVWVKPNKPGPFRKAADVIRAATTIAIANPDHAPAGRYAREALVFNSEWQEVQEKLIFANDARMAAQYVADGLVDAGIIYRSDARAFHDQVAIIEPLHLPPQMAIRYEGISFLRGQDDHAVNFLRFLASSEMAIHWKNAGFDPGPR